jgi:sugar-specific transcriptional regulator TrmB
MTRTRQEGRRQPILDSLGVSAEDEAAYRALLDLPRCSVTEVAAATGRGTSALARSLHRLADLGLVSQLPGPPTRYLATRPDLAVESLVARRTDEFERSRAAARALLAELPVDRTHRPEDQVEIVVGREAVAGRFRQLQESAREEMLVLDRPPYAQNASEPNPAEDPLLGRGVVLRAVYAPEAFDVPGAFALAQAAIAAGEQARVHADVPMKMVVTDLRCALLPLTDDQVHSVESALVVHNPTLVGALAKMFELLWESALPLPAVDPGPGGWSDGRSTEITDPQLLGLLVAGLKDETIARQLGVSLRTVQRRISTLMTELGARTRFQAGVAARDRLIPR